MNAACQTMSLFFSTLSKKHPPLSPLLLGSRALVRLQGEGVFTFLHGLSTQNFEGTWGKGGEEGKVLPLSFLNPKGKVLAECLAMREGGEGKESLFLDIHSEIKENILRFLLKHRVRQPIAIDDVSSDLGVFLENPDEKSEKSYLGGGEDLRCSLLPSRFVGERGKGGGGGEVDVSPEFSRFLIRAGIPESPREVAPSKSFPLALNLDFLNAVKFDKGCYVGQEMTNRTLKRGVVRSRTVCIFSKRLEGGEIIAPVSDEKVEIGGEEVQRGGEVVGKVISWDEEIGCGLASLKSPEGVPLNWKEDARRGLGDMGEMEVKGEASAVKVYSMIPAYFS